MNCNQAELAMMEHMEKTIRPARARDLAQHVLGCEACREYYVGFDMAFEVLNDAELSIPPADFTQSVMAQVRKLPAHTPPEPSASVALHILWGLGAIVLGIGLLLAFNPDWMAALTEAYPIVYNMTNAVNSVWLSITETFARITPANQTTGAANGLSVFNMALIFVVVVGALLVVLQRSEKSHNS